MSAKTIVILGGGVGGLVAANELARQLSSQHKIVLVEKNTVHAFAPSFLWVMTGNRSTPQITRGLQQLLLPRIELVSSEVRSMDLAQRHVETSKGFLSYDYLVVSLGAELAPETVSGLPGDFHTFFTLEGSARLRDALRSFDRGTIGVVICSLPYKCPGAPHEAVMLIDNLFRRRKIRRQVDIHLFTPETQPMPVARPELGHAISEVLRQKDIHFHPEHKLTSVNSEVKELDFGNKGKFQYDLLVAIPPHRSPRVVRESGLANATGWVSVDRATLATSQTGVFALGDVTLIPLPGRWKPDVPLALPKAGVFAHAQAQVVARRITAEISGSVVRDQFCADGYCMLEAGEGLAGFAYGNFFLEPSPQLNLKTIGRTWHWGKLLFEQWWLSTPGFKRDVLASAIKMGGRFYGILAII